MPFPFAAVAAAVTTAALTAQRNNAVTGRAVGKLGGGGAAAALNPLTMMNPIENVQRGTNTAAGIAQAITQVLAPTPAPRGSLSIIPRASIPGAGGMTMQYIQRRRYRRTNVGNIKALRRAGRRLTAFVKLAKSMVRLEERARIKKRRRR